MCGNQNFWVSESLYYTLYYLDIIRRCQNQARNGSKSRPWKIPFLQISNWCQKVCQSSGFSLKTRSQSFESLVETSKPILLPQNSIQHIYHSCSLPLSAILMKVQPKLPLIPKQYPRSLERFWFQKINYFNIYCTYNFSEKWINSFLDPSNLASNESFSSKIFLA